MISIVHRRGLFLPILGALLLVSAGCSDSSHQNPEPVNPGFNTLQTGDKAPEFVRMDVEGDSVRVGPGQPLTLINLWATWCAPCIEEFPDIEQIHRELGPKGLRVLAVNVDEVDSEALRSFGRELDVTFPLVIDPPATIQDAYRALAMPSSYLVDEEGNVMMAWTGRLPHDTFSVISQLMAPAG